MTISARTRSGIIGAVVAVAGVTAIAVLTRRWLRQQRTLTATIALPPHAAYEAWRDLSNLPRFLRWVETVDEKSSRRSHWRVRMPDGAHTGWDTEIIEDRPGERLVWRTVGAAALPHRATLTFRPDGEGTAITITATGALTKAQLAEDLARFVEVIEAA